MPLSMFIYYCDIVQIGVFKMKSICCLSLMFIINCHLFASEIEDSPPGLRSEITLMLDSATYYMNNSRYDAAQAVISRLFTSGEYSLTDRELYFVHCYESEIMYYNALFDLGLNSALRAREIAIKLENDTLIGSVENLCGLFFLNLNQLETAKERFVVSVKLLSPSLDKDYLSYQYHALTNLAECFLKMNQADSAIYYSRLAQPEALKKNRNRGLAIIDWNIAEALLLKNKPDEALDMLRSGLTYLKNSNHIDVIELTYSTMLKAFSMKNEKDSIQQYHDLGLKLIDNELITDYARLEFLRIASSICLDHRLNERAGLMLRQLLSLQQSTFAKQQSQQLLILQEFFKKNENLLIAKQGAQLKEQELINQQYVIIIGSILFLALLLISLVGYTTFRQKQKLTALKHKQEILDQEKNNELQVLKRRMEAVFEERNRIAADLHDDIGASLSSIRIYSGAALQLQERKPEEISGLLYKINTGSTNMMESMSDIIWSINPKNDHGHNLILRMRSHAAEFLDAASIIWRLEADNLVANAVLNQDFRRIVYLIFKETLTNIVKHAQAKMVHITLRNSNGIFYMYIVDDGNGFNTQQVVFGNGIKNLRQRASQLDGEIHWESSPDNGTKVEFYCSIARFSE